MFRTLLAVALSSILSLSYAADNVSGGNEAEEAGVASSAPVKVSKPAVKKAKVVKKGKTAAAKLTTPVAPASAVAEPVVFELSSGDIGANTTINKRFEYDGFGCAGENRSPDLQWTGAPEGTKSFAVTVYDPDAPTGSGWWHWIVYDIPADTEQLEAGAGTLNSTTLPENAVQAVSDYGVEAWGGMCPPKGDKAHRYVFTVHALNVEQLELPDGGTSAAVRYLIHANTIATATFTAKYGRKK